MDKTELIVEKISKNKVIKKGQKFIGSRSGVRFVSIVSFLEAALPAPILTDPFLIASILANKKNTHKLIFVTTLWSVIGGVCAYFTASFFFEWLLKVLNTGIIEDFQAMISTNTMNTFVLTIVGAITPVPYTLVAWTVAVLDGGLIVFVLASILGRGLRYLVVGYLTYKFGLLAVDYTKRYLNLITVAIVTLVILYIWLGM